MSYNQPPMGQNSTTFEIRSHAYDQLDSPDRRWASPTLAEPGHADQVLQGEFVHMNDQVIEKVVAGSLLTPAYVRACRQSNGRPGRTDLQMGFCPIIYTREYRFDTWLIDPALTYGPGVELSIGIIATPKANVAGLVPLGTVGAGTVVVAVCCSGIRANGAIEAQHI